MKVIKLILISILLFNLSCSRQIEKKNNETPMNTKQENNIVETDSIDIKKYLPLLSSSNSFQQEVIKQIISNIQTLRIKEVKEDILTIGEIDGILKQDTIRTKIFVRNDSVFLTSTWIRNNELLWQVTISDPYMWISDNELFDYRTADIWTRLTIAKDYSLPELSPRSDFSSITDDWVVKNGIADLGVRGIETSIEEYQDYINQFNGMVLTYGEPEARQLMIWHEPTKSFLTYYAP
jgi:hypothetical protein